MSKKEKMLRSTMMVTLVIILSKAFGFVRDMVTTSYFGLSFENDAYNSAYSLFYLPVLLFNSCISATFIPLFLDERAKKGEKAANRFASNAINLFAAASIVVTVLFIALSKPLVTLVYQGFDEAKIEATAKLLRVMVMALVFNVTSISLASLLNAAEKYISAQLTGFPLSLCVIVASVCFSERFGIIAVAWGVFAANVLQFLILIPFLTGWFKYHPVMDIRDENFRRLMKLAVPAMFAMGISELNHMIDRMLASGLAEGTLSAMTSAYRLVTFVQGVLVVPLTTIMFSKMSKRVAEGDERGALDMLLSSVTSLMSVVLPIVAIGFVLSGDVIRFAYMRGKFTADDVVITAGILSFYLIGIPGFGIRDFLSRMFHALKDTKTPFLVSIAVVASNIILNVILRALMGANGLALATSIASYIGVTLLLILLKKRFGHIGLRGCLTEMLKIFGATAVAAIAAVMMDSVMPAASGTLMSLIRLGVGAMVAFAAYIAAGLALKLDSLKQVVSAVAGRFNR